MHVETILIVFKAPSFISLIQKENIRIKMLKLIKFIFSISMVFAFRTPGIEYVINSDPLRHVYGSPYDQFD